MAVTATPVFTQAPKLFTASINNGDAQAWKLLKDPSGNGAGANGAKVTAVTATSTDSSARDVQLGLVRSATVTITIASPGVVTWANHNLSNGDQVFFSTTGALPTGLTAGTTYFVVSANQAAGTFQLSATFGGAAINTSGSQSGTHTGYAVRPVATASCAITAGTVSGTPSANLFANWTGLPVDNDGNQYVFLESGDWLSVSAAATVTSGKIIEVGAIGANF